MGRVIDAVRFGNQARKMNQDAPGRKEPWQTTFICFSAEGFLKAG
jgi:hypothetical protein